MIETIKRDFGRVDVLMNNAGVGSRLAEPEEIVGSALFLASDMASYITGTYIQIDGGAYGAGF